MLRLLSNVLTLEPSLNEPDVRVRIDSGESASSLARDKLLCRQREKQHLICLEMLTQTTEISFCLYRKRSKSVITTS